MSNHLTTDDLFICSFFMKKIITLILLFTGSLLLGNITSAQFTPTTCNEGTHCSAPTPGVKYKDTIVYIWEQWEEFDLGFQQNFDKQKTLLLEIFVSDTKNFPEERKWV